MPSSRRDTSPIPDIHPAPKDAPEMIDPKMNRARTLQP